MPTLSNFTQFDGRYWDTASIRNALDYEGAIAPHTGEPYTEALLLGVSGGITFGYFTFHYDGYDPQVNLLTRNTFEPMQTIFERMGIAQDILQTTNPSKARQNIIQTLEEGHVPIIFPDMWSLPYNALSTTEMYGGMPIVLFGYEPEKGEALVSDRAYIPLTVPIDDLDKAMSRIKKDKHRLMILEHPDSSRLVSAVRAGIQDCIALMTEKPPRGSVTNFGLKALQHWANMLEKETKGTWAQAYPTGRPLLSVLISSYTFLSPAFGKTMQAERDTYADFLDEAATILNKPELTNVAIRYRVAGKAWHGLMCALLPEDVPMLKKAREYIDIKAESFIQNGNLAVDEMKRCEVQLAALKKQSETDFPMTSAEIADLRAEIRCHVLMVHDAEQDAVLALKTAMA